MTFDVKFNTFATGDGTTGRAIRFNKDGKLKVMHITDTHLDDDNIDATVWLIAKSCDKENPDVVVITGDNVCNMDDASVTKGYIDRLMSIFEKRNIPTAVTFGNHDSERGAMSREELMAYYNRYSCSVSVDDGEELSGCGTYNVPVLASDSDEIRFNIWMFDSGDYDEKGRYANVLEDQVEWYKKKSDAVASANNGKKVYSFAFQHTIVPDVYDALKKVDKYKLFSFSHMYNKNDFYMFDPNGINYGTFNETPCCGYYNHGQFEAMVEKGDVLGIFTGHDHTNAFGVKHKGIDIVNTVSSRYNFDKFSSQYGYRILNVDENNPSVYTSRVEHWYDMFSCADISSIKTSGDAFGYKTAKSVTVNGIGRKMFERICRTFTRIVTGRRVTYKD